MSDDIFGGMRPGRPQDELTAHVLRAARSAGVAGAEARRRGWGFGRLDAAWVAACLVLLACHAALTLRAPGQEKSAAVTRKTDSATVADSELARQVGLPGLGTTTHQPRASSDHPLTLDRILRADS